MATAKRGRERQTINVTSPAVNGQQSTDNGQWEMESIVLIHDSCETRTNLNNVSFLSPLRLFHSRQSCLEIRKGAISAARSYAPARRLQQITVRLERRRVGPISSTS